MGAALMWFNVSPKGKEMRAKLVEHVQSLFDELKNSIKQLEGPTQEMYEALVDRAVEEYAVKKDMAVEMKVMLIKELKKKWKELENDIRG